MAILDSSGSVGYKGFKKVKEFLYSLIMEASIDDGEAQLGILRYSDTAEIQFHMNEYNNRAEMADAIDAIQFQSGTTNTAEALRVAREQMFTSANGDRPGRNNVIILFTDGSSDDMEKTLAEAKLTRLAGINILVVAVGSWVKMNEVREIASDPDDFTVFQVPDFDSLPDIAFGLRAAFCNGEFCHIMSWTIQHKTLRRYLHQFLINGNEQQSGHIPIYPQNPTVSG